MKKICLISCVSSKVKYKTKASELYTSSLFLKAREFASNNFDSWYILSAKYGLLHPDDIIEPYDQTLNKMQIDHRKKWTNSVYETLKKTIPINSKITFIAGQKYREFLMPMLEKSGYETVVPMQGLSIGMQLAWLNNKNYEFQTINNINRFYKLIDILRDGLGGYRVFSECNGKLNWPKRGVYFIFENNETRRLISQSLRVVRVGTHAVSKNSASTFWNRLLTHRGTENGLGNHRSSIFRLHIGKALMNKYPKKFTSDSWGIGQAATIDIRNPELTLEAAVSEIIAKMKLLWLSIGDEPSSHSDRSYIEKNSIGLLTKLSPAIDPPSESWLGLHSHKKRIRNSGLWNLDYNNYNYDPSFLDIFEKYVFSTIGRSKPIDGSIAPKNWYKNSLKMSSIQLKLFESE